MDIGVNRFGATRNNMTVMAVVYAIMGISLLVQGHRWAATPAYHNLLAIMPQEAWGSVFCLVTTLLAAGVGFYHKHRWLVIVALTLGVGVTTGWDFAFLVRWITSANTTPETWASWSVFDYMFMRAFARLDFEEITLPRQRS